MYDFSRAVKFAILHILAMEIFHWTDGMFIWWYCNFQFFLFNQLFL